MTHDALNAIVRKYMTEQMGLNDFDTDQQSNWLYGHMFTFGCQLLGSQVEAEQAVRHLLEALGEDPTREGLLETPRRMAKMLTELCTREPFNFTVFDSGGMDQMVIQTNIPFVSLCEHHLAPFEGEAHVAYIPNGKIVGLSKLARAVGYCAKGLQTQERITIAVADMLQTNLEPLGVGVVLKAMHSCMSMRGVKVAGVWTTTSCMRGALMEGAARSEFLALVK